MSYLKGAWTGSNRRPTEPQSVILTNWTTGTIWFCGCKGSHFLPNCQTFGRFFNENIDLWLFWGINTTQNARFTISKIANRPISHIHPFWGQRRKYASKKKCASQKVTFWTAAYGCWCSRCGHVGHSVAGVRMAPLRRRTQVHCLWRQSCCRCSTAGA